MMIRNKSTQAQNYIRTQIKNQTKREEREKKPQFPLFLLLFASIQRNFISANNQTAPQYLQFTIDAGI